jgi:hypothetical protein
MRTWYARLFSGFINSLIVFTLINAPVVFNYPVGDVFSGVAYADDDEPTTDDIPTSEDTTGEDTSEDCQEDNTEQEGTYLYKPGCAFKNEASTVDSIEPEMWMHLLNSLIALSMLAMIIYYKTPRNILDCKASVGHHSIRIAQIAALSYIISEFVTNQQYRDIAKEATDYNFVPTEKTDDLAQTNEQVAAFDALLKIYESQLDVTKTKLAMSILLEAGYASSLAMELINTGVCTGLCSGSRPTTTASINTMVGTTMPATIATFESAAFVPSALIPSVKSKVACYMAPGVGFGAFQTALKAIPVTYAARNATLEAAGVAVTGKAVGMEEAEFAAATTEWASLLGGPVAYAAVATATLTAKEVKEVSRLAEEAGFAAANQASDLAFVGTEATVAGTLKGAWTACNAALAADLATNCPALVVGATACATAVETTRAAVNAAYIAMIGQIGALQGLYRVPTPCCGSDGYTGWIEPTYRVPLPLVSIFPIRKDIRVEKTTAMTDPNSKMKDIIRRVVDISSRESLPEENINILFQKKISQAQVAYLFTEGNHLNDFEKIIEGFRIGEKFERNVASNLVGNSTIKDMLEKILYNIQMESTLKKVKKMGIQDPKLERKILAQKVQKLNQTMNLERMFFQNNKIHMANMDHYLKKMFGKNDPTFEQSLLEIKQQVASQFGIDPALAEGGGGFWMELLSVGAMTLVLYLVCIKWIKTTGAVSPKMRSWIWGGFMAVAAGVITKNGIQIANINDKIEIVEKERQKFIDATGIKTKMSDHNGGDGKSGAGDYSFSEAKMQHRQGNQMGSCADVAADGSFVPSKCPSNITPDSLNVPGLSQRSLSQMDPGFGSAMGALTTAAYNGATTGIPSSEYGGGTIEGAKKNNAAMRKALLRKMKELDKTLRKPKNSKDKGYVAGFESAAAAVGKSWSSGAVTAEQAKSLAAVGQQLQKEMLEEPKKEEKGEAQVSMGKVPEFNIPQADFNFDMGDQDMGQPKTGLGAVKKGEKGEKNLKDFVVQHDDINKKKEVSIFKILSNRYILSYPKIIPEKKRSKPQTQNTNRPKTLEEQL